MHTNDELIALFNGLLLETTLGKRSGEDKKTFQLPAEKLHISAVEKVMRYGFQRLVNDRVGGDDMKLDDKIADSEIFLGKLCDGTWRTEARRQSADLFTTVARKHVIGLLPKEKRKELAESPDKGVAYLDAVFAKNEAKLRPEVEAIIQRMREEAEARAKLADTLDLDV
jgi:hypothetical protein